MIFHQADRVLVLFPLKLAQGYDYLVPTGMTLQSGAFVKVSLGRKKEIGVVWGPGTSALDSSKMKEIETLFDLPPLSKAHRNFIDWVADYTLTPKGNVLKMSLPVNTVFSPPRQKNKLEKTFCLPKLEALTLSSDQKKALEELKAKENKFSVTLLDGVTGSGKTEVFFSFVQSVLDQGKQALIMVPEIALTSQLLTRFEKRFGTLPALWHSDTSSAARRETWLALLKGQAKVIIGARSALFLPFENLGLIVVDEEHDSSFKQDEGVLYHARDMAVVRAQMEDIPLILSSATPSLETLLNVEKKKYDVIDLPSRHGGASLPDVHLIDLKEHPCEKGHWLSPVLIEKIEQTLKAKEQVMLFLNRRGYAPLTLCQKCGHRLRCPDCTAWLVSHKTKGSLMCHHCGHVITLPKICPNCNSKDSFVLWGPGVERVAEEASQLFPKARLCVISSDTMTSPKAIEEMMNQISSHQVDILIGTQILAKGHHFPALTLVGGVDADLSLGGEDLRASEKTFQMLHQVSGRAGREDKKGSVYLQTFNPEHPVMQALKANDRDQFIQAEIKDRKEAKMPPFGRLGALIISGAQKEKVQQVCTQLARGIPYDEKIHVFGPAPAPLSVLRKQHRMRFLVHTLREIKIQKFFQAWLKKISVPHQIKIKVDIDPQYFM